ncbi:hypothetical protein [Notoacmeibacter ruber]|uniref:Uncharacterized protein n=1 Tax=Notoacmeibacter ruber TaxID=2670375 RepID=A0A3L7J2L8_9HYPH|nr:hypothetical protein [Notoacmeibacter ruber]RLQ84843.1 hypothetical protein D8780_15640 [Notoacmeibacter ruber]
MHGDAVAHSSSPAALRLSFGWPRIAEAVLTIANGLGITLPIEFKAHDDVSLPVVMIVAV